MRKAGDRIEGSVVKQLRSQAGLSQQQLAERVGVSGKGVISMWERDGVEGPAAELILLLFGGGDVDGRAVAISAKMDDLWRRGGSPLWREVFAFPARDRVMSDDRFKSLLPGVPIPADETAFGFPFGPYGGLPPSVVSVGTEAWTGSIPAEIDRPIAYGWRLDRRAQFVYREKAWDLERREIGGNMHLIALLESAALVTVFASRLAEHLGDEKSAEWHLGICANGVRGRGVVALRGGGGPPDRVDDPVQLCADDRRRTVVSTSLESIQRRPLSVITGIVQEFIGPLRPDLATVTKLEAALRRHVEYDREVRSARHRVMTFLEDLL